MTSITPNHTILFYGDSITDCGRDRANPVSPGNGYVGLINAWLGFNAPSPTRRIINTGVSGDRIYDLARRLDADVLEHNPEIVTILIGINDTWRQFDSNVVSPIADFQKTYRDILRKITATRTDTKPCHLVLMEPFVLPVPQDRRQWRDDVNARIAVVRDLAAEFSTDLIPLDGMFAAAATRAPASYWLPDGVHPSPAGHALIADAWLRNFRKCCCGT